MTSTPAVSRGCMPRLARDASYVYGFWGRFGERSSKMERGEQAFSALALLAQDPTKAAECARTPNASRILDAHRIWRSLWSARVFRRFTYEHPTIKPLMKNRPLRTTVIGSYPFPGWLEFACRHLDQFGEEDRAQLKDDAVIAAIHDQVAAGLDVITDGEQTRLDFNLSFYGFLEGIELESASPRRFGPPAHDQRGRHKVTGQLRAPRGLGAVEEFQRLKRLAPAGPVLKASVPGPYTLSGRLIPNPKYPDRWALAEALLPLVRMELEGLINAGCREITVDEPSMSC